MRKHAPCPSESEQPIKAFTPKEGSLHSPERIQSFFSDIAPRYDLANHLLSGGCDYYWRRRAAGMVKEWEPRRILDLASGRTACEANILFCFGPHHGLVGLCIELRGAPYRRLSADGFAQNSNRGKRLDRA